MDNLIDRYLGFYADMIGSSVSILSEDVKQNKKFNDVIYDYLNEIVLGNDYVDNKELVNAVGFKASDSKLAFFKLLIDYGIVSRLELKDIGVYRTFMFIVDATMFFISLYSYVNNESVGEYSLDKLSKKIFKEMEFNILFTFSFITGNSIWGMCFSPWNTQKLLLLSKCPHTLSLCFPQLYPT